MIKKLFNLLNKDDKIKGFKALIIIIFQAFVEVTGAAAIFPLLLIIIDDNKGRDNFIINQFSSVTKNLGISANINQNAILIILLLLLTLIILFIRIYSSYIKINFLESVRHSIGKRLLYSYLNQNYEYFINKNASDLAKNLLSEVDQIIGKVLYPIINMCAQLIIGIGLLIFLFALNSSIALFLIIFTGLLYFIFYRTIAKSLVKIGSIRLINQKKRFISANEILVGIKSIKINNIEEHSSKKFTIPNEIFTKMNTKRQIINESPAYIIEAIALIGLLIFALIKIVNNNSTNPESIAIIGLYGYTFFKLKPSINSLFSGFSGLKYGEKTINKIHNDLKIYQNILSENKNLKKVKNIKLEKEFSLKNISYKYAKNSKYTLKDINIKINKGESIAIVGTTGCGKTTLSNIILGLFKPTSGVVLVDNIELNKNNVLSWQDSIGYVSQDLFMLDATIAENISFGRRANQNNNHAIKIAAQKAKIDYFIENKLENGYETIIGDRGMRISGGEKQRIAIARALYKDPEIIIFDEATSSLDPSTEKEVINEIKDLAKSKTVIMIAHRLSTVKDCDLIILLNNGLVEAMGNYEELKSNNNSFSRMLDK